MPKTTSIILFVFMILIVVIMLFIPVSNMEDCTDSYNLYKEVKDYRKISELEEYLNTNNIKYKKNEDNILLYLKDGNNYADQVFITIETECKVKPGTYDINFEKLDEVYQKSGKEYITLINDGIKYTYLEGKYYITWINSLWLKRIGIVSGIVLAIFWLYLGFKPKKKEV